MLFDAHKTQSSINPVVVGAFKAPVLSILFCVGPLRAHILEGKGVSQLKLISLTDKAYFIPSHLFLFYFYVNLSVKTSSEIERL
jgi:hypothetical protein